MSRPRELSIKPGKTLCAGSGDLAINISPPSGAIAGYESRFAKMENDFIEIRGTLQLDSWMLTTAIAMLVALLFKVFSL